MINGSDLAARTEQILVDLLSLEVNTIWSESITGERYPGVEQALHEVDKLYAEHLGIAPLAHGELPPAERLMVLADEARRRRDGVENDDQRAILARISSNGYTLARILHIQPNPALWAPTERATLRKVWDMGTEIIVAQTIITLDGDVTMRVRPSALAEPRLLDVHKQQVGAAMTFWRGLVDVLSTLVTSLRTGLR